MFQNEMSSRPSVAWFCYCLSFAKAVTTLVSKATSLQNDARLGKHGNTAILGSGSVCLALQASSFF